MASDHVYAVANPPPNATALATVADLGAIACVNGSSWQVDDAVPPDATCSGGVVGSNTADVSTITGLSGSWWGGVLAGNGLGTD